MHAQTFIELIQAGAPAEASLEAAEAAQEYKRLHKAARDLKEELADIPEGDHRRVQVYDDLQEVRAVRDTMRFLWMESEKVALGWVGLPRGKEE